MAVKNKKDEWLVEASAKIKQKTKQTQRFKMTTSEEGFQGSIMRPTVYSGKEKKKSSSSNRFF